MRQLADPRRRRQSPPAARAFPAWCRHRPQSPLRHRYRRLRPARCNCSLCAPDRVRALRPRPGAKRHIRSHNRAPARALLRRSARRAQMPAAAKPKYAEWVSRRTATTKPPAGQGSGGCRAIAPACAHRCVDPCAAAIRATPPSSPLSHKPSASAAPTGPPPIMMMSNLSAMHQRFDVGDRFRRGLGKHLRADAVTSTSSSMRMPMFRHSAPARRRRRGYSNPAPPSAPCRARASRH